MSTKHMGMSADIPSRQTPDDLFIETVLQPCPFCGAPDPFFRGMLDCHYIQCMGCGASGPDCDDPGEASRTWNLRESGLKGEGGEAS